MINEVVLYSTFLGLTASIFVLYFKLKFKDSQIDTYVEIIKNLNKRNKQLEKRKIIESTRTEESHILELGGFQVKTCYHNFCLSCDHKKMVYTKTNDVLRIECEDFRKCTMLNHLHKKRIEQGSDMN